MKTLFIKVALLAAAVLGPLGAAARSLKVHVENPGTLGAFFKEHDMEGVTALTLTGRINWSDIDAIDNINRQIGYTIKTLDVAETRIAKNQDFPDDTQNDVWPAYAGMNNMKGYTSIILPSTLKYIMINAFNSTGLTSVTLPATLDSIGASAFCNNMLLKSVSLPEGLKSLGDGAFLGCRDLESVTFPTEMGRIGVSAFYRCDSLTSVVLPERMQSIGRSAFEGCTHLASVTFPAQMDSIGTWAF